MYVIATVICPNFHFSVSPHVPFLNLLFERDSYSNASLFAKFRFDTAENEPSKVCPLGPRDEKPGSRMGAPSGSLADGRGDREQAEVDDVQQRREADLEDGVHGLRCK